MTKKDLIKKVSAFIKNKPQSITLNIDQLEGLTSLEAALYCAWEDIKKFNDEIGNDHWRCNDCQEKKNKDDGNK